MFYNGFLFINTFWLKRIFIWRSINFSFPAHPHLNIILFACHVVASKKKNTKGGWELKNFPFQNHSAIRYFLEFYPYPRAFAQAVLRHFVASDSAYPQITLHGFSGVSHLVTAFCTSYVSAVHFAHEISVNASCRVVIPQKGGLN